MKQVLSGQKVLVTRPEHQSAALIKAIEQAGGEAVSFPVLAIAPTTRLDQAKQKWQQLSGYQWIVFISANAVNYMADMLGGKIELPETIDVAAIGKATATALMQHGIAVDLMPLNGYNSEALLQMPEWQDLTGQKVMIVRGEGGREKLAQTLKQRGAETDYMEVYRRIKPESDHRKIKTLLERNDLSAIVLMSGEAVQNLCTMLNPDDALRSIPVVVISARIAEIAAGLGFRRVLVSQGVSEQAIVDTLKMLNNGEKSG